MYFGWILIALGMVNQTISARVFGIKVCTALFELHNDESLVLKTNLN